MKSIVSRMRAARALEPTPSLREPLPSHREIVMRGNAAKRGALKERERCMGIIMDAEDRGLLTFDQSEALLNLISPPRA
jgi:hypothetical protein